MTEPAIFIIKTAEDGAMLEREAIAQTIDRWAVDLHSKRFSSGMTVSTRLRLLAGVIRRGEHHRPRMGR